MINAKCDWGSSDPMDPFISSNISCCDISLGNSARNILPKGSTDLNLGDLARRVQKRLQQRLGKSFEVIASTKNFAIASHYHGSSSCKLETSHGVFLIYATPQQYDVTDLANENWFASVDSDEPLGGVKVRRVRGAFPDIRSDPTAGEDKSIQPPTYEIDKFPNLFAEDDPDDEVSTSAFVSAKKLDDEEAGMRNETEAMLAAMGDEDAAAASANVTDLRYQIDVGPHPRIRNLRNHRKVEALPPGTDCGGKAGGNVCCDGQLAATMRDAYNKLAQSPLFDEDAADILARAIQRRVQLRYGKSFEVIASKGNFEYKSHQVGDRICKFKLKKFTIFAYATPIQYDIEDETKEQELADVSINEPLGRNDSHLEGEAPDTVPLKLNGEDTEESKAGLPMGSHCSPVRTGSRCCSVEVFNAMQEAYEKARKDPDFNPYNLRALSKKIQWGVEDVLGHSTEVIVSSRDFVHSSTFGGDNVCKYRIDEYQVLAYQSPVKYPIHSTDYDVDLGEAKDFPCPGNPGVLKGDTCCDGGVAYEIEKTIHTMNKTRFNSGGNQRFAQLLMENQQRRFGTVFDVVIAPSNFVLSTARYNQRACKMDVRGYSVLSYQTSPLLPPLSDFQLTTFDPTPFLQQPPVPSQIAQPPVQSFNAPFQQPLVQQAQIIQQPQIIQQQVVQQQIFQQPQQFQQQIIQQPQQFQQQIIQQPQQFQQQVVQQQFFQQQAVQAQAQPAGAEQSAVVAPRPIAGGRAADPPNTGTGLGGGGGGGGACFSTDTWLTTPHGKKRMDQVSVGDYVLTANHTATFYTPITMWIHREPDTRHNFVTIMTDYGKMLALTAKHLMFRNKCNDDYDERVKTLPRNRQAVFAEELKVGDCVVLLYKGKFRQQRIQQIQITNRKGIFAPLTANGRIIVNDMVASCYSDVKQITLQNSYFALIESIQNKLKFLLGEFLHNQSSIPYGASMSFDLLRLARRFSSRVLSKTNAHVLIWRWRADRCTWRWSGNRLTAIKELTAHLFPANRRLFNMLFVLIVCFPIVVSYTTQPPCCRDHLGGPACQRMQKQNTRQFSRRCNTDAEFRLVQCCSTCNANGTSMAYDLVARSLVSEHCFDRYGSQFCGRYVNATDVFEPHSTWSCDGENPQIAFRACRLSCGYCDFSRVSYTLENAQKACRIATTGWRDRLLQIKYGKKDNWLLDGDQQ
ncbi:unnamed protein product [Caenorhabditis auriculariae]|uniref:Ground-like domain-containing protein n=1 Tax=Caenorhabditis auriculariae TaxID=2777116 RepID=A0A8S1HER4_9PELO|nr:unnamed protein product [Caenorhabditis auriculariae]